MNDSDDIDPALVKEKIIAVGMRIYRSRTERAALRGGMADAAAICDVIEQQIKNEHRIRGGRISKRGLELAAVAKRCGDEIHELMKTIGFEDVEGGC